MLAGEGVALSTAVEAAFYEPARPIPLAPELIGTIAMSYRRGHRPAGTRALRDFLRGVFAGLPA